jgi:hypothetical protein
MIEHFLVQGFGMPTGRLIEDVHLSLDITGAVIEWNWQFLNVKNWELRSGKNRNTFNWFYLQETIVIFDLKNVSGDTP